MTDKIEHEEFYFGNDKVLLQKINENEFWWCYQR